MSYRLPLDSASTGTKSCPSPQSDRCCSDDEVITERKPYFSRSSSEDSVDSSDGRKGKKKKKKIKSLKHLEWIGSWPTYKASYENQYYCACTAGYKGGYGVIIRDRAGYPVVAATYKTALPESSRYHHLQGVARGIELALECALFDMELFCNKKRVVNFVKRVLDSMYGCVIHGSSSSKGCVVDFEASPSVCKGCVVDFAGKTDYDLVFPLLQKIVVMVPLLSPSFNMFTCSRIDNKAACYLAKKGDVEPGQDKVMLPSMFGF